jgi:hypothetical protein
MLNYGQEAQEAFLEGIELCLFYGLGGVIRAEV